MATEMWNKSLRDFIPREPGQLLFISCECLRALFILFPLPELLFPFAALNEMEEVAQEEGEAAGQAQDELPAPSQAVVPMEVDEEQAGNCVWEEITSLRDSFSILSLVLLQLSCLILNDDVIAQFGAVKEFVLCYNPELSLHMQGNTLTLKPDFCAQCNKSQKA